MTTVSKKLKFEDALQQLDDIVEKLESGSLSLEDSLKTFEQGTQLSQFCQQKLKEAEGKVEVLMKQLNDHLTEDAQ